MKLRRSRLTCREVNRQSPRRCEPLCNSGPVFGSAGNKERLLLRTAPKCNLRQPCSLCPSLKAAAALNCVRSLRLSLLRGDREFESPFLRQRVRLTLEFRDCKKGPAPHRLLIATQLEAVVGERQRNLSDLAGEIQRQLRSTAAREGYGTAPAASGSGLAMARPRVFGSSTSMTIISAWARVENTAIAVPSGADSLRWRKMDSNQCGSGPAPMSKF